MFLLYKFELIIYLTFCKNSHIYTRELDSHSHFEISIHHVVCLSGELWESKMLIIEIFSFTLQLSKTKDDHTVRYEDR